MQLALVLLTAAACAYGSLPEAPDAGGETPAPVAPGGDDTALPPAPPPDSCDAKAAAAQAEYNELVAKGAAVDAWHTPACAADGSYEREQCMYGMVASCWCVDPMTGEEEEHTRLQGADAFQRPIPCGAVA